MGADIIELRLDFLDSIEQSSLKELMQLSDNNCIVTYRPVWEGGNFDGNEDQRMDMLLQAIEFGAAFVDIELKVAQKFMEKIPKGSQTKIIVSNHNFEDTLPLEDLRKKIDEMW